MSRDYRGVKRTYQGAKSSGADVFTLALVPRSEKVSGRGGPERMARVRGDIATAKSKPDKPANKPTNKLAEALERIKSQGIGGQ